MPIARAATTALTFTAKLSRELPLRYSRLPLAPFARSPGTTRLEVCTEESTDSGHSLFAQCNSRNAERPFRFSTGSRTARVQVWHAGQAAPLISTVSALISHITALAEFRSLAALPFSKSPIFTSEALTKISAASISSEWPLCWLGLAGGVGRLLPAVTFRRGLRRRPRYGVFARAFRARKSRFFGSFITK